MYLISEIPEEHRPEIILDISDNNLYTLIVQDHLFKKINRKYVFRYAPVPAATVAADEKFISSIEAAYKGYYFCDKSLFKNIIDKNIPCILMHKVKNKWASEIDTIVLFLTGECNDIFLIHPKDLTEWDPNEGI